VSDVFAPLARDLGAAFQKSSGEPWPDEVFALWAHRIFEYQVETNPVYAAFAHKRGVTPATLAHWTEIPWVPASAFKALPLVSGDASQVKRVFRTSGTTGSGRRGEHHVLDLELYRDSLLPNMRRHLYSSGAGRDNPARLAADGRSHEGGVERPILALTPDPSDAPESSLSFMLGVALEVLSGGSGGFFITRDAGIDTRGLDNALTEATAHGTPILLAGTAFAFVHWLDWLKEQGRAFDLPPGSLIMETGGFKGRSRVLARPDFYASLSEAHGIPMEAIVNEYGMTEMLSQFYDHPEAATPGLALEERRHVPPPWVRTRVLDPITLSPLPLGEPGLLCHVDLANAGSVMAILTEDLGFAVEDGFRVLGRAQGAEPRGCSLAMDDLLSGESV
jgi:hypothetical protein